MNEMVTIPREEYDRLRAAGEDLADLLRLGVNRVTVAEIETDRKQRAIAPPRVLTGALGVALDDLAE